MNIAKRIKSKYNLFLSLKSLLLISIFCFSGIISLNCQKIIPAPSLFEFYEGNIERYINISERIREKWDFNNNFLLHAHYNANTDIYVEPEKLTQVLYIYRKKNDFNNHIIELLDDGIHYDNEPNDHIYGNYIDENFSELLTMEYTIDVSWGGPSLSVTAITPPVSHLQGIPQIIAPAHKSTISNNKPEIIWEIDEVADGCGIILLGSEPELGEELKDIIWEKEFRDTVCTLYTETLPIELINQKEYTLIVWTYTNTITALADWEKNSYSIEWCQFTVDTTNITNSLFVSQNFPNPFNSGTTIKYSLPTQSNVCVKLYNIMGKEINILKNDEQSAGEHYVYWDGKDNSGRDVSSGVYFYTIIFNDQSITNKMLLVR